MLKRAAILWNRLNLLLGKSGAKAILAVFIVVNLAVWSIPWLTEWIDHLAVDLVQRLSVEFLNPSERLVTVVIDDDFLEATGNSWPLDRSVLGGLVGAVASGQPRLIVLDILLQNSTNDERDRSDEALEGAIRTAGNVALISIGEETTDSRGRRFREYHSLPRFRGAARFSGLVWNIQDSDQIHRSFLIRDPGRELESMAFLVNRAQGVGSSTVLSGARGVRSSFLAFSGGGRPIPEVGASRLLGGKLPPGFLRDKIVVVGVTARAAGDFLMSPLGLVSGVKLLSTAIDTLLTGRSVQFVDSSLARIAAGIQGMGASLFICFLGVFPGLTALLSILAVSATVLLASFFLTGWYIPVGGFCVSWIFTACAVSVAENLVGFADFFNVQNEAEAVGDIQRLLFPEEEWDVPEGFLLTGYCRPFSDAGGDFFDFHRVGNTPFFFLGDVSGHGFAAAMTTIMIKSSFAHCLRKGRTEPMLLIRTTDRLLKAVLKGQKFMTGVFGYLDTVRNCATCHFAGHLAIYHIDRGGKVREFGKPSFPLGAGRKRDPVIATVEIPIGPGERLILCSDGVIEARDPADKLFGFPRWASLLGNLAGEGRNGALISRVMSELELFVGGTNFPDDVTILIVQGKAVPLALSSGPGPEGEEKSK